MHELLLLRHAKSSWDDTGLDDFDRPLNARGQRDAPRMAGEMNRRGWFPQRAIISAARRTRQTWDLLEECLPTACEAVIDPDLYEARPDAILASIRKPRSGSAAFSSWATTRGSRPWQAALAARTPKPERSRPCRPSFRRPGWHGSSCQDRGAR